MKRHTSIGENFNAKGSARTKTGALLNLFRQRNAAAVLNLIMALDLAGVHV